MGPFGKIILFYFAMGIAVAILAPAIISEQQTLLGINTSTSSFGMNTSEMNAAEMAGNLPSDPSEGHGALPSGGTVLLGGLISAWNGLVLAMNVFTWPAMIFSGLGIMGAILGWIFTFMFFIALFMWIRGVT